MFKNTFCHIRYCDQYANENLLCMLKEIPLIRDFHDDWALLHFSLRDFEDNEKYLDALELLL